MPLDPQCQNLLAALASMDLPAFADMTPEATRQAVHGFTMLMGEPEVVAGVEDRQLPGPGGPVPVRIYTPAGAGPGPLPVLVWFHLGGFVFAPSSGWTPSPGRWPTARAASSCRSTTASPPSIPIPPPATTPGRR